LEAFFLKMTQKKQLRIKISLAPLNRDKNCLRNEKIYIELTLFLANILMFLNYLYKKKLNCLDTDLLQKYFIGTTTARV